MPHTRTKPYTKRGIRRIPCSRCDAPSYADWQVCADGRQRRTLCVDCDIALNTLVLKWVGDPDWREKIAKYAVRVRKDAVA